MLEQTPIPNENPSSALQVETDHAALSLDVAAARSARLRWTGRGFAVLMLIGVSVRVLAPLASHASAKSSRPVPEAAFAPTMPSAFLTGASSGVRFGQRDQRPGAASMPAASSRLARPGAASTQVLLSPPGMASGADTIARMRHMVKDYARQPRATVRHAATGAFASSFSPRPPAGASRRAATVRLAAGPSADGEGKRGGLWFVLDINTKGGIVFYSILGIALPFVADAYLTGPMEVDETFAHNLITGLYLGVGTLGWTGTYVFRVATKDMTYARQLQDYETAVIEKRFEELSEVEADLLLDQVFSTDPLSGPTIQPTSAASEPKANWKPDYGEDAPQPKAKWKPDYGEDAPPQSPEAEAPPAEKEGLTFAEFMGGDKGKR